MRYIDLCWTSRSWLFPQLPLGYDPVTPSRRVATPPCEPSVAGPSRSRASTGVQRSPERRPVQRRIKFFQFARKSSRSFENFFFLFHPVCKVQGAPARCGVRGESNQPPGSSQSFLHCRSCLRQGATGRKSRVVIENEVTVRWQI